MKVKLAKFGGSSVANAERIKYVIDEIVLKDKEIKYVVFSTFGKATKDDIKITDLLEKIAFTYFYENNFLSDFFEKIKNKYINESKKLEIETKDIEKSFIELETIIKNKPLNYDKYYSAVVSQGERMFIQIPYLYLKNKKIKTAIAYPEKIGMITNSNYRNASLLKESYSRVREAIDELNADIVLIPGFYTIDDKNDFTIFRRGGSDFTGALISNIMEVDLYLNYTDVDGILRVDPTLFPEEERSKIEKIEIISYRELRELSYGGAKVIHSGTLKPLSEKNIPLVIKNTFNKDGSGTLVVKKKEKTYEVVKGIAMRDNIYFLNVEMENMDDEIGVGHFIEEILYKKNISFTQVTSSIDSLSYAIPSPETIDEAIKEEFDYKLKSIVKYLKTNDKFEFNDVYLLYPNCLIYIVGEGMQNTIGLAAKFASILAKNKINIITTYQAPEQINVIYGIKSEDGPKAVRALYYELFVNRDKNLSIESDNIILKLKNEIKEFNSKIIGEITDKINIIQEEDMLIIKYQNFFSPAEQELCKKEETLKILKELKEKIYKETLEKFKNLIEKIINKKIQNIDISIDYKKFEKICIVKF
ncbi:MAG TPA: aspartate kinase [bacterium]|nr:aspartate kinase [bacterium]HOL47759.1 aspartate kinase [bacterium]HPQ19364.1 aspartate kinase [bacterium]